MDVAAVIEKLRKAANSLQTGVFIRNTHLINVIRAFTTRGPPKHF